MYVCANEKRPTKPITAVFCTCLCSVGISFSFFLWIAVCHNTNPSKSRQWRTSSFQFLRNPSLLFWHQHYQILRNIIPQKVSVFRRKGSSCLFLGLIVALRVTKILQSWVNSDSQIRYILDKSHDKDCIQFSISPQQNATIRMNSLQFNNNWRQEEQGEVRGRLY